MSTRETTGSKGSKVERLDQTQPLNEDQTGVTSLHLSESTLESYLGIV